MDLVTKDTKEMMTCMICWQTFDCSGNSSPRLDTIKKHHKRKHDELRGYDVSRKKLIIRKYVKEKEESQNEMTKLTTPDWLSKVAPYKMAFIIGQYKRPFSDCQMLMEFAMSADPNSPVFARMRSSRQTVTRGMVNIHDYIVKKYTMMSIVHCFGLQWLMNDRLICHRAADFVCSIVNIAKKCVQTQFLAVEPLEGHPKFRKYNF
ncbi:uncharacterized protein LOC134184170 [Corticium candelabrum]|uniref:uncharacterized protein LOC134184170 n=1 Tax=Corticium candelabrum TaxID=121492 RepID=UPI002E255E7A|nr:uncharacterized protein LOC134184170 [Corticium candelabrum]